MAPVPNELLVELRNVFRERFNLSDLSDLCQELGIDIENLPGTSRNEKARELAAYLGRRDMVGKLAVVGPKSYPDVPWLEILGRYGYAPPAPDAGRQPTLSVRHLQLSLHRLPQRSGVSRGNAIPGAPALSGRAFHARDRANSER